MTPVMPTTASEARRRRSDSVNQALAEREPCVTSVPSTAPAEKTHSGPLAWLVQPKQTLPVILAVVAAWFALEHISPGSNPITPFLFISHPLPLEPADNGEQRYGKGPRDFVFLLFYIVVFSFLREAVTEYLVRPLARNLGLKSESKIVRFTEQGYAFVYLSASATFGLYVMSKQPSWWYKTEHFWLGYPHWRMDGSLKSYYLLQFSYWLQQMIVLVMGLEKPRLDFTELVIHHIVTLWLVGWSYLLNFTMIGTAVFVSMDIPDIVLALSKCLNYLEYCQRPSEITFVIFLCSWHYFRQWLNFRILRSVWYDSFRLIPLEWRTWSTVEQGSWVLSGVGTGVVPEWIRYQIFAPLFVLFLLNIVWSYHIWRVLIRILMGQNATDVREEGEEAAEDVKSKNTGDRRKKW
ncbi:hypothetical protein JCM8547_002488 [Rhodosporidiobolus lusitaniae]